MKGLIYNPTELHKFLMLYAGRSNYEFLIMEGYEND